MISIYLSLGLLILGINIVPVLMPPTWTVLAFFVTKYELYLIPAVLIGALFATLGRIILAKLADLYFRKLLSNSSQENYLAIGKYLNTHQKLTIPLVVTYAFLPIPSNDVFIAAGLAKVNIKILAGSFFFGRLISYTFWVGASRHLAGNLEEIFNTHLGNIGVIALELFGLVIIFIVGKIGWKSILKKVK